LELTQVEAVELVGLSERTYYHWQANPTVQPRRSSVENLSRVHALVEGLVTDLGEEWARMWLRQGSPARLERMHDPEGLRSVEDESLEVMKDHLMGAIGRIEVGPDEVDTQTSADLFASRERVVPDPLPSFVVSHEHEDDRG
jgi:hypothetical protein